MLELMLGNALLSLDIPPLKFVKPFSLSTKVISHLNWSLNIPVFLQVHPPICLPMLPYRSFLENLYTSWAQACGHCS